MTTALIDPRKQQIVDRVIELVIDGATLRDACATAQITMQSFHRILCSERELSAHYARAMELRADVWADETVQIADTDADPARARNRINARQWGAAKTHSRKYGERIDLNINQQISIDGALLEAKQRLRPVRDQLDIEDADIVEPQALDAPRPTDTQSVAVPAEPESGEPDIFS